MKYVQLASLSTPAAVSAWFQDELVNRGVDAAYTYYVLSLLRGEPEDSDQDEGYHYSPSSRARSENHRLRAKKCAIECLKSAADSNEGFEALVEELLVRLQPTEESSEVVNYPPITTTTTTTENSNNLNQQGSTVKKSLAERAKKYFDAFPALQVESKSVEVCQVFEKSTWNGISLKDSSISKVKRRKNKKKKSSSPEIINTEPLLRKANTARSIEIPENESVDQSFEESVKVENHQQPTMMGSMYHEESLINNLTKKFDSKLAAIWADVPTVNEEPWLSLDHQTTRVSSTGGCDDVIFSIPNSLSIFNTIFDDDDDLFAPPDSLDGVDCTPEERITKEINEVKSECFDSELAFNKLFKNETTDSKEAGVPAQPTLCLKNSTLNYDREKTAFSEVVPSRKSASAMSRDANDDPYRSANIGGLDFFSTADDDEDLLISPKTHFTPIRADPEDLDERPPSSSLGELASYHLPPEPPKRACNNAKASHKSPAVSKCTASAVKDDEVKALWKLVDFEAQSPVAESDILGVAHCWNDDAVTSGVSIELKQEILAEEDELFKDIFGGNIHDSSLMEDSGNITDSLQDNSLDCSLDETSAFQGQSCSLEYLSHFSNGFQPEDLFDTPELYDSAIVTSVRSIQDMQRRKKQQKKPCTFYMEGNCRRTDCKFSHDLSAITCRFWEEGSCFKGLACPFLHGYAPAVSDSPSTQSTGSNNALAKKESKRNSKYTIGAPCMASSFVAVATFEGRATVGGVRVARRLPVFRRLWPSFKDSEQDFPSLSGLSNKSAAIQKAAAKKTLKNQKCSGNLLIVTKKATKKKRKKSSADSGSSTKDTAEKKKSDSGKKTVEASASSHGGNISSNRTPKKE